MNWGPACASAPGLFHFSTTMTVNFMRDFANGIHPPRF
jgi:hypothetical protein